MLKSTVLLLYYKQIKNIKLLRDDYLKNIFKNSSILMAGGTIWSILNFISFTIMSKSIGPAALGLLVLGQTFAMIFNDIFNIQTWEAMIKFGTERRRYVSIASIIKTNLLLDLISALIAFLFAFSSIRPIAYFLGWGQDCVYAVQLYVWSVIFNITTLTIGVPRLFNRFFDISVLHVIVAFVKLILIIIAFFITDDFRLYLMVYLFCDILLNIVLMTYSFRLLKKELGKRWMKGKINLDKKQLKFIWWTNLRTIIRIPVRYFDMVLISAIISLEMVGIYKVYKELAGLIDRFAEPVNQAIFPEFSKLLGENKIEITANVAKKTITLLFILSVILTSCLIIFSYFIIDTFFGKQYLVYINVFRMMLFISGVNFVIMPINSLFIAAGFARYSFNIVLLVNIVYLISAYCLGKLLGIYGLVMAICIQIFLNQGAKFYFLKKYRHQWGMIIK